MTLFVLFSSESDEQIVLKFQEQVQHTSFGVLSVRVYYNMDCEILSVEGKKRTSALSSRKQTALCVSRQIFLGTTILLFSTEIFPAG